MDQEQFDSKQQLQSESNMVDTQMQQQRLDIQKTIADDKLQLAVERMQQQAELKLMELQSKLRGN